jgi:hypothetical protein
MVKLWKTKPGCIRIPIKHGLKSCDYLEEDSLFLVCLTENEAYIEGLKCRCLLGNFGNHTANVNLILDDRLVPSSDHDWGDFRDWVSFEVKRKHISRYEEEILLDRHTTITRGRQC